MRVPDILRCLDLERGTLRKRAARLVVEMLAKMLRREVGQRAEPNDGAADALSAGIPRSVFQRRTKSRTSPVSCMRCGLHCALPETADLGDHLTRHFTRSSRHCNHDRRAAIETATLNRIDNNVLRCATKRAGETDGIEQAECVA